MKTYLTINELARYIKVSKPTIYKWLAKNQIPHLRIRNIIRFELETIEAFLREHQKQVA